MVSDIHISNDINSTLNATTIVPTDIHTNDHNLVISNDTDE